MVLLEQMRDTSGELQTLAERLFDDFPFLTEQWPRVTALTGPALDLYEKNGGYVLDVTVPGYTPKDVNIEVSGNTVTVTGSQTETSEKKGAKYYRREMRTGSFRRSVALPQEIDAGKVDAKIDKGVLTINLTPIKTIAAKKIEIKGA